MNRLLMEAELQHHREKVRMLFTELIEIDKNRLDKMRLIESQSGKEAAEQFENLTRRSVFLLRDLEQTYLRLMGYVLLIRERGHRDTTFQDLLRRYRMLEPLLRQVRRAREKQVHYLQKIMARLEGRKRWLPLSFLRSRFYTFVKEEHDAMLLISGIYTQQEEKMAQIQAALELEEKKRRAVMAAASAAFLIPIPGIGMAMLFLTANAFQWANKYSENHKKLRRLVSS